MSRIWRILSIDGGGVRGIIPAIILASIEQRTGKPISQLFDLIAGTSTGGILALGLTKPDQSGQPEFSAAQLCELYHEEIPNIFGDPRSWWGNLLSPKYRSFAFQRVLKNAFTESRLRSALSDVLIPCYDIEHRVPYIFKSQLAKQHSECDFPMRDVALAASASPTLFHPVPIQKSSDGRSIYMVDGGVFANNPSIIAFAEIKSIPAVENDSYFMVSLGTGKSTRPLTDEFISLWGYLQWSRPMLELVMESNSESVHDQMKHLLTVSEGPPYYRLQVDLPRTVDPAIDNASVKNMQVLTYAANRFCSEGKSAEELSAVCESLMRLSTPQLHSQFGSRSR